MWTQLRIHVFNSLLVKLIISTNKGPWLIKSLTTMNVSQYNQTYNSVELWSTSKCSPKQENMKTTRQNINDTFDE